jgi:hypothetical protein
VLLVPDPDDPPTGAQLLEDDLIRLAPGTPAWKLPKPDYTGEKWW